MMARVNCKHNIWNFIIVVFLELSVCVRAITGVNSCVSPTASCDCFVEDGKKIVNCRYRNLTVIPTFVKTNIVYDEIRFTSTETTGTCYPSAGCNIIRQIGANAFANLKVRKIDLRNNPVTSVDDRAFSDLTPELESLLLEGDGANDLPYQALALLDEHLKYLHLEHYGTHGIRIPTVLPFPNLVSLTLESWPRLEYFDADRFNIIQNLKEINLIKLPSLLSLPVPVIRKFVKLTTIDIMDTGIRSVFGETFTPLSMLKEIKVHNNIFLNHIDKRAFNGVTDTVEYLDIDNNNLNNIEFLRSANWTVLSHLNIGYNFDLRTFPAGIFNNAPSLHYLSCQDVGLTNIDGTMFSGLSNLHTLDLAYNQITTIKTGAFQNLLALTELYLNDQKIYHERILFHNNAFDGIETSVEILSLGHNIFDVIQFWSDISKFRNLEVLDLENTGINNIPDKAFGSNTKLKRLVLSNNNITSLTQTTFYGPRNTLRTIDLHGNNIHYIDQCTLSDFPIKPVMILDGNPLVCNCNLVWLYDWFKNQSNQDFLSIDIGKCQSPKHLSGMFFGVFSRADMCPGGVILRTCPDVYATTSTTPTSATQTTRLSSAAPVPYFESIVKKVTTNSVEVSWLISDKTYVTGLKVKLHSNNNAQTIGYAGLDQTSYTFIALTPDSYYSVCLVLEVSGTFRDTEPDCKHFKTLPNTTVKPAAAVPLEPGHIVG